MTCRCSAISRRSFLKFTGVATLPLVGACDDSSVDLVSDETVEQMGLQAWSEIRSNTPVSQNANMQGTLDGVATRLLRAQGHDPKDWEVLVFAKPEINAFALPGRKIGVFEGMFRVTGTVDQLAAIVGHEIGHLEAEHGQERMSAQVGAQWGLDILAFLLASAEIEYAEEIAAALGLGVQYGLVLPYNRRQELEADRLGLFAMAEAGYDPAEAVELWRRMEEATRQSPEFLSTHPAPESRIEAIEEMLPEVRRG